MKIQGLLTRKNVLRAVAGLLLVLAFSSKARADITIYDSAPWTISVDGRTSAFYSYEHGDASPHFTAAQIAANGGVPPMMTGGLISSGFSDQPDQDPAMCAATGFANGQPCTFTTSRVHSGFVGNIFGFTAKRRISETLTATGRIALWWPVETDQYRGFSSMSPDPRESYAKLEGRWGGVLFGRTLGLHDRGSTLIDYYYANGNSIGSPCNASLQGPLCGFIGYGYQFPGYNAGIIYNTPLVGGFQLSAGIYDPVRVGLQDVLLTILPLPRVESEGTYTFKGDRLFFTAYVNGMWQQAGGFIMGVDAMGATTNTKKIDNAYGVSYGGRVEIAGFKLGVGGNYDIGGGDLSGLVGSVPIDHAGELRRVTGYLGQAMYSVGSFDFSGGGGITMVQQTASDIAVQNSVIKTRFAQQGSVNYHVDSNVVFNVQYFHAQHTFWLGQIQDLNFFHTGMTFVW